MNHRDVCWALFTIGAIMFSAAIWMDPELTAHAQVACQSGVILCASLVIVIAGEW